MGQIAAEHCAGRDFEHTTFYNNTEEASAQRGTKTWLAYLWHAVQDSDNNIPMGEKKQRL
jgi:hypothetical protein